MFGLSDTVAVPGNAQLAFVVPGVNPGSAQCLLET